MKIRDFCYVVVILAVFAFLCPCAFAANEQDIRDKWQITFTPYVWALEIDTDVTLRGLTGSVDTSFGDIWDNLDMAAFGRLEAWRNKWGLFVDAMYAEISRWK